MPWFELISLLLLGTLAWLWFDSTQVREIAVREARRACEAEGFQFLDETVVISSLKPMRDEDGRLALRRTYSFEFSDTGNNRRPGSIILLGQEVLLMNVGLRLVTTDD
jgi:hypothetical protein